MAGGPKKVVVRYLNGDLTWGYLPFSNFVVAGQVELLDVAGKVISFPLKAIQWIAYVRDFNLADSSDPEELSKRRFSGRPRIGGLWLRLGFAEDDQLEGVADFDLASIASLAADGGIMLTPPDTRGNTQRVFVPQTALAAIEVLGWISSPAKAIKPKPKHAADEGQADLFGER